MAGEFDEIRGRLEGIAEELADLAIQRLRESIDAGGHEGPIDERRLTPGPPRRGGHRPPPGTRRDPLIPDDSGSLGGVQGVDQAPEAAVMAEVHVEDEAGEVEVVVVGHLLRQRTGLLECAFAPQLVVQPPSRSGVPRRCPFASG